MAGGWSIAAAKAWWRSHRASAAAGTKLSADSQTSGRNLDDDSQQMANMSAETIDTPAGLPIPSSHLK